MTTPLSSARRSALRAEAHKLDPVVIIGDKGLTDEVVAEIDRSLKAHELIKVRAVTDDRAARGVWMEEICARLDAHPVQAIGKVLVIYRENFDKPREKKMDPGSLPHRGARDDKKRSGTRVGTKRSGARDHKGGADARGDKTRADARVYKKRADAGTDKKRADAGTDKKRGDAEGDSTTRTSRSRSRTPSPRPESLPRRRRPRSSQ
jgi:putative YhbY family RNA-binding protein